MNHTSIRALFRANSVFLLPYALFLLVAGSVLCLYPRADIHLYINAHSRVWGDDFFRIVTNLGDGLFVFLVALCFLAYRVENGLLLGISGILAGLFTQVLKRTVFSSWERPKKFFEGVHDLYLVPGVTNYSGHTFPSGHAASAFALYFAIAVLTPNKALKLFLFLVAGTVAFSRVYLSQHFLNDVYAGSLLGIFSVILAWWILRSKPFEGKAWLNKSLLMKNKSAA